MQVIIVGCGKIGFTIAKNLSGEKNINITIIDNKSNALEKASETVDVMLIQGSGLNADVLISAGVKEADLIISVTNSDESNILCCILAKSLGIKHTVARIRNPEYTLELDKFWKNLGLDMIINPEMQTARELSRILRFSTADSVSTFVNDRVELVSINISDIQYFVNKSVSQIFNKKRVNVLLVTVERNNEVIIPNGDFILYKGDIIKIIGRPSHIMDFLIMSGERAEKINSVAIIGGSRITYYLTELLQRHSKNTNIKIIELNKEKCEELSSVYPRCIIINADGTDENVLESEVIGSTQAVICLTDRDEQNTIIALYALKLGMRKVALKINYINKGIVKNLGLGSIVSPQSLTADQIVRYVRGMRNINGKNIKTINRIFDNGKNKVEAIEFNIPKNSKYINVPIKGMDLKSGFLIGCIARGNEIIIPSGDTVLKVNDNVIVIAKDYNICDFEDIFVAGR